MEKPAETRFAIHELLRRRWSPRAFADRPVEPEIFGSLFEAARWAPSCNNRQPWQYLVARKQEAAEFDRMLACLVPGNAAWCKDAPALMISVANTRWDNGDPNPYGWHDVGQAGAQLTIEAVSRGLFVHQMAGILPDKIRETYAIPEGFEPVAGFALGYPGDANKLSDRLRERELAPRARKPLESFVFSGHWGQTSLLVNPKR
ncbi:MAG TPA: nitroreductase family protein [Candidatus Acidoferrales bacterium]|nr:nitroreductase family protein [Candidatus Acidoferrales bacterium]